jgi:alcohol dehydrogenase class IV
MMKPFSYVSRPFRVLFGHGTIGSLPTELDSLQLMRVLVLSTPEQRDLAETVADGLGSRVAGIHPHARMHTPVEVTERAMEVVRELGVDGLVAVGGGSTTGLAKAIALRTDLPQIIIPTTYAGSEMTPILGETSGGSKTTRTDPGVQPELVLYDVDLTVTLPVGLSTVSGLNAIAHAVEALYSRERNPIVSLMAVEGISALTRALPTIVTNPSDIEARSDALYGAWLCGVCLGAVGMALHHKLCHTLGGSFDLPHAQTHAVVLPHSLAFNAPAAADAMARLQPILGDDPALGLYNLLIRTNAPIALRDLGMPESAIDVAADRALLNAYWNPRPLTRAGVRALIARAWAGEPPQS